MTGHLLTLTPNRKFAATARIAADVGLAPGDEDRLVRRNAVFVWTYYLRFARLATRGGRRALLGRVVVHGGENLDRALAPGRGTILLSVHLGDFDVAGAWLAAHRSVTPVVVARAITPRWREAVFSGIRRRCGVVVREAEGTSLADLAGDLRCGRAVLIMLDRRPSGPTCASRMLDRPAVVPLSVSLLAARTGASLLPAASWRDEGGAPVAWFGPPDVAEDVATAAEIIAETSESLSAVIRRHPTQWHVPADLREMAWSADPAGLQPSSNSPSKAAVATSPARRMAR